jgi:hypothetical protein
MPDAKAKANAKANCSSRIVYSHWMKAITPFFAWK